MPRPPRPVAVPMGTGRGRPGVAGAPGHAAVRPDEDGAGGGDVLELCPAGFVICWRPWRSQGGCGARAAACHGLPAGRLQGQVRAEEIDGRSGHRCR